MPEQEAIVDALKTVIDPELNVNVVDLGLVYTIQSREDGGRRRDDSDDPRLSRRPGDP